MWPFNKNKKNEESVSMTTVNAFKHPMGIIARDLVSGFEGMIVVRVQHITGCSTYGLAPKSADGKVGDTEHFNENRIVPVEGAEGFAWEGEMEFDKIFINPIGAKAKDKITGFTGVITSRIEYLFNANSNGVTPPMDKDGKLPDGYQFDEGRMEILPEPKPLKQEDVASPKRGSMYNRDAPKL